MCKREMEERESNNRESDRERDRERVRGRETINV